MEPGFVVVDRYRLIDRLGAGGMGVVWRAEDQMLEREVALKWITFAGLTSEQLIAETRRRTLREARAAARLRNHRQVIAIYDVIVEDGDVWLVLEYLPSRSLDETLKERGRLDPAEVARIGAAVADALAAGHAAGIVHRDVKPGNVLLGTDGSVKLTDFGISHLVDDPKITLTGQLSGTVAYASPEWARDGTTTPGSDLYSLGSTLYAAVEGQPPFGTDDNHVRLMGVVRNGAIRPPVMAGPLEPMLLRLLEIDPATRPDAATARDQLAHLAHRLCAPTDPQHPAHPQYPVAAQHPAVTRRTGPLSGAQGTAVAPPEWHPPDAPSPPADGPRPPARRRRRRGVLVAGALVAAAALTVGVLAATGALTPIDPTAVPELPASVRTVALDGDQRAADPCAMINPTQLSSLGRARLNQSYLLAGCQARIAPHNGSGEARLNVSFGDGTGSSQIPGARQQLGGVTIIRQGNGELGCRNLLALDTVTVYLTTDRYTDRSGIDICAVTEAATAIAVNALAESGVVYTPGRHVGYPLADDDACAVLDAATLDPISTSIAYQRIPGFANWSCSYGTRRSGQPSVRVDLLLREPSASFPGRPTNVAGKTASTEPEAGTYNSRACRVYVMHRLADQAGRQSEVFNVVVESPSPADDLCAQATTLAETIEKNLPTE